MLNRLHFLYPNTVIDQKHIYDATGEMFHLVQLEDYRSVDDMPAPTLEQVHYDEAGKTLSAQRPGHGSVPSRSTLGGRGQALNADGM